MPILNDGLTTADFKAGPGRFSWSMRAGDLQGFLGTPTVVKLTGGFRLYKLTGDGAPEGPYGVTPWWSTVLPWKENREGAGGRYEQAVLNGIDLSSMVRYMSAVVVGWNALSEYVEVSIHPSWEVYCFWGKFAPMKLIGSEADIDKSVTYGKTSSAGYSQAVLPADIGVLLGWQFFVPGLKNEHLAAGSGRKKIDAHDMGALGKYFGLSSAVSLRRAAVKMPSPEEFMKATFVSQVQARNAELKSMDEILKQFTQACPTLIPNIHNPAQMKLLHDFCGHGDEYKKLSQDPMKVKGAVEGFVKIARDWCR